MSSRSVSDPIAALPYEIGSDLVAALRDALELGVPEIFTDVTTLAQTAIVFRETNPAALVSALDAMHAGIEAYVSPRHIARARAIITDARKELDVVRLADHPVIDPAAPHGPTAQRYLDALLEGDEQRGAREVLLAVASGAKITEVYEQIITPVLHEAGRLWQRNEMTVSQEHVITAAVERLMAQLMDLAPARAHRDLSVVSASLGSSQHQVGARMVADAFSLCGWQATYLGSTVPVDDLLDYVDRISVDVLALSATLTRDVIAIRDLIHAMAERAVAPVVIVGGRAFAKHPKLWKAIGADGYAATPLMAVALANELVTHCDG